MFLALTEVNRVLGSLSDNPADKERLKALLQDIKHWYDKYQSSVAKQIFFFGQFRLLEEKLKHIAAIDVEKTDFQQLLPDLKTFFSTVCDKKENPLVIPPKDSTQKWMLDRMQALGYPYTRDEKGNPAGHCYGVAHMAAQAFLAGEIERFSQRLSIMESIPVEDYQNDFADLRQKQAQLKREGAIDEAEEVDELLIDIKAFFDGVSLLQNAHDDLYEGFHENTDPIHVTNKILPIVCPSVLDKPGMRPVNVKSVIGAYSKEQLSQYLELLQKSLGNQSFSLLFMGAGHEINLNYNHITKEWLLIDSNHLPGEVYFHLDLLAEAITQAFTFSLSKRDGIVTLAEFYISDGDKAQFDADFEVLEKQEAWNNLHKLSHENLSKQYGLDWATPITYALMFGNHPEILEAASTLARNELDTAIHMWSLHTEPKQRAHLVQVMLKKLDRDSAKKLYTRFCNFCPEEDKEVLLHTVAELAPSWITSGRDFSEFILTLNDTEKTILYEACKMRLIECIQSAYDFKCALKNLNEPEQRREIFAAIKPRLISEWITSVDSFSGALCCLGEKERSELFTIFKSQLLSESIQSGHDFGCVLLYLNESERREVFLTLKSRLISEWLNCCSDLSSIFQRLPKKECEELWGAVKVRLASEWMNSADDFRVSAHHLAENERLWLFDAIKESLFTKWQLSVANFILIRRLLPSEAQAVFFGNTLHRLIASIKENGDYLFLVQQLEPDEQITLIENSKEKLAEIASVHNIIVIFDELSTSKAKAAFINVQMDHIALIINSQPNLRDMLEHISADHHLAILKAIQHKIPLILSDTFEISDTLDSLASTQARAIVFEALQDTLPELMEEARLFELETLIQFYDEWMGNQEDASNNRVKP